MKRSVCPWGLAVRRTDWGMMQGGALPCWRRGFLEADGSSGCLKKDTDEARSFAAKAGNFPGLSALISAADLRFADIVVLCSVPGTRMPKVQGLPDGLGGR